MIWGPDNKPAKEFATEKAYGDFENRRRLAQMREEVDKKRDSKKPEDVLQRGDYCLATKDFQTATQAFSAVITIDPKSEDAARAHLGRGEVGLFGGHDFARAAADFSDFLHWAKAKHLAESENVYPDFQWVYLFRGLSYANQENCLDQALADITTVVGVKDDRDPPDCVLVSRLVRRAIYLRRNELDKALADVTVAIHSNPKWPDSYAVRSLIYARQGDQAKAEADRKTFAALPAATADMERAIHDVELATALRRTLLRLAPALKTVGCGVVQEYAAHAVCGDNVTRRVTDTLANARQSPPRRVTPGDPGCVY